MAPIHRPCEEVRFPGDVWAGKNDVQNGPHVVRAVPDDVWAVFHNDGAVPHEIWNVLEGMAMGASRQRLRRPLLTTATWPWPPSETASKRPKQPNRQPRPPTNEVIVVSSRRSSFFSESCQSLKAKECRNYWTRMNNTIDHVIYQLTFERCRGIKFQLPPNKANPAPS